MSYQPSTTRYEDTPQARCGRSGLALPLISLGLWHNFGDVDDQAVAREMILRGFDRGITHFDLANNYGPPAGSSELNFGRILRSDLGPWRDELIISTKAGYRMWPGPYGEYGSRKYLLASLDQSLDRMGIDYVDIFYSHRPDPETPLEETMGALASAVQQGKALYVGISSYDADMTRRAAAILRELKTPCLIHQPYYNMFDRWVESELLPALEEEGIGCIAFCPLAQGLLTGRYLDGIPEDSRVAKMHGFLKEDRIPKWIDKIRALNILAAERGQSLAQLAITWVLRRTEVTSALIGASKVSQIDDCLGALKNLHLREDELAAIDGVLVE